MTENQTPDSSIRPTGLPSKASLPVPPLIVIRLDEFTEGVQTVFPGPVKSSIISSAAFAANPARQRII